MIQKEFQMDKWNLAPPIPVWQSHFVFDSFSHHLICNFQTLLKGFWNNIWFSCFAVSVTFNCAKATRDPWLMTEVLIVIPVASKHPLMVDILKQYFCLKWSSLYFILTWIESTAVSEVVFLLLSKNIFLILLFFHFAENCYWVLRLQEKVNYSPLNVSIICAQQLNYYFNGVHDEEATISTRRIDFIVLVVPTVVEFMFISLGQIWFICVIDEILNMLNSILRVRM